MTLPPKSDQPFGQPEESNSKGDDNQPKPPETLEPSASPPQIPAGFSVPPAYLPSEIGLSGFVAHQKVSAQFWQSPFPPPDAVERFEKLQPGSFDRILKLVEKRQEAEITLSTRGQDFQRLDTRRAHWMGYSTIVIVLLLAASLAFFGKTPVALALLAADVIGVGGALFLQNHEILKGIFKNVEAPK